MRLTVALLAACSLPSGEDYRDPAVGGSALAAVEMCRQDRNLPCGWVYWFDGAQIELCLPWEDRIGPWPVGLRASAESLYGASELSRDARFAGTPLCRYTCPPERGCNATGSCFCPDGAP